MDRTVDDKSLLDSFASDFAGVVEKHAKYIIVSGFVAIAHGRSRGTEDIDMIIEHLTRVSFTKLHEDLESSGFECIQNEIPSELYDNYLEKNTSIRYVRKGTHIPEMELKLAKDALDENQLNDRVKLPLTGLDLYFSSIETNIAFKEELLKADKDIEDAKHLRVIYEGKLDEKEIEKIKSLIRRMRLR